MSYGHNRLEGGQAYIQPRKKNPVIEAGLGFVFAGATTLGIQAAIEYATKQSGANSFTGAVKDTFKKQTRQEITEGTRNLFKKPNTNKLGQQAHNAFKGVKKIAGKIANSTRALWQKEGGRSAFIIAGIIGGVSAVSAFFGTIQNNKPVPIDFKRM
jgi:hypothetical protein